MKDNPDKKVAEAIYNKFKDENLLTNTDLNKIMNELVTGKITEEDWNLMAELALDKKEGEENVEKN
jgi:hypothetical protein